MQAVSQRTYTLGPTFPFTCSLNFCVTLDDVLTSPVNDISPENDHRQRVKPVVAHFHNPCRNDDPLSSYLVSSNDETNYYPPIISA